VTAYVGTPLCAGAKRELASEGAMAGDVRVRVTCLVSAERNGRLDLSAVGVNARRATEDSTAIAYVEASGSGNRFSRPILESPGVPWIYGSSGSAAMGCLLHAIREAGAAGSLRDAVAEALHET
jgi:hypothetical protein